MKKILFIIACYILAFSLSGCFFPYNISEKGDTAEIILKDGVEYESELVLVTDSGLVFFNPPYAGPFSTQLKEFFYVPKEKISSVTIQGYNGEEWRTSVCLFQAVPAGVIGLAAAIYGGATGIFIGMVMGIPAMINFIIFSATQEENPSWNESMDLQGLDSLKIYSRYPNGLNSEELEFLLKNNSQKTINQL